MDTSRFIASRMGRISSAQGVMAHISATAVGVSVAVMIVTLAVVFGFRREMTTIVSRMAAEVTITDLRSLRTGGNAPIGDTAALRAIVSEAVAGEVADASIAAYAVRAGVARSDSAATGVLLKGLESHDEAARFGDCLTTGALPRFEANRRKEILLPESGAKALGAKAGDKVELLFLEGDGTLRRDVFKVCGVYASGLDDGRTAVALTDIRNVRKISGWDDATISGYEVRTADFDSADSVAEAVNEALVGRYEGDENLVAVSARMLYADVLNWLGTHDVNAAVVVTIMFVVALFNMITALLILILEQTRMIGILKAMGMHNGELRRIFTQRAARIVLRGTVWGSAVGIGLALVQRYTHAIGLDAASYGVSAVPIELGAWWIVALDVVFVAAILLLSAVATTLVARIRPADAIRYE